MTRQAAAAHLTVPVAKRDHVLGPATAPVTLVEYGDFECPYCGQAYFVTKALTEQLGRRLRFVFRHFPLVTIHPYAELAAEAAEAAAAEGKFWEMHSMLFEHQDALDAESLAMYADAIGLDVPKFTDELTTHVHAPRVREDFSSGVRSGVNGTPTFFINGARYDAELDLATLLKAIEANAD